MAFKPLFKRIPLGIRSYCSCISVNDAYIVSGARTPIGSFHGKLSSLTGVQLGTQALSAAIERSKIQTEDIAELFLGCTFIAGMGQAPCRQIAMHAGLPSTVTTSSVNKLCGSGLKAVISATQTILTYTQEVVAVCGLESLSNVPFILRRKKPEYGHICVRDMIISDALSDMFDQTNVTEFAEITAKEYNFSRNDQDDYAIESYMRSTASQEKGYFKSQIVPVVIKQKVGEEVVREDEEPKRYVAEKFRKIKPELGKDGTITAGNTSALGDGAACMILASGNYVLKKALRPIAKIVSYADACLDPKKFCVAPSVAIPKALVRANLEAHDISLWEISETFALTALVNMKLLKLDSEKVNVHGGAVSLGHPFGMTGVRLLIHLANALKSGDYGCASISHAGGGSSAVIIQKF